MGTVSFEARRLIGNVTNGFCPVFQAGRISSISVFQRWEIVFGGLLGLFICRESVRPFVFFPFGILGSLELVLWFRSQF